MKNGKWTRIGDISGTACTIKNLKANTAYKFAVKPYRKVGSTIGYSENFNTISTRTLK
jgi:hypothetical protein